MVTSVFNAVLEKSYWWLDFLTLGRTLVNFISSTFPLFVNKLRKVLNANIELFLFNCNRRNAAEQMQGLGKVAPGKQKVRENMDTINTNKKLI